MKIGVQQGDYSSVFSIVEHKKHPPEEVEFYSKIPERVHKEFTKDYFKQVEEIYKKAIPINIPKPPSNVGIVQQIEIAHDPKYADYRKYEKIANEKIKGLWEKLWKKHYDRYEE